MIELQTEFIIGLDFLRDHNATIRFGENKISLDPRRYIETRGAVRIAPKSEQVIQAKLKGKALPNGVVGIVSGEALKHNSLVTANILARVQDGLVPFRIMNVSDSPINIPTHCTLGKFVCLSASDNIFSLDNGTECSMGNEFSNVGVTSNNQVNIDLSQSDISRDEKVRLSHLVDEFHDVFVGNDNILGRRDIIPHRIEVDPDHSPFRQRTCRTTPSKRGALENIITEM